MQTLYTSLAPARSPASHDHRTTSTTPAASSASRLGRDRLRIAVGDPAHLGAALLIANTIRLSIFSRRREIEVDEARRGDELVRARPVHDRGPPAGFGGAVFAVLLLTVGKELAVPAILHHALSTAPDVHALAFPLTALILLAIGLGLGAVGSGLTLRRFLKV